MTQNGESILDDLKNGNIDKVEQILKSGGGNINDKDI